jgi:uncharacterized protein YkuJ
MTKIPIHPEFIIEYRNNNYFTDKGKFLAQVKIAMNNDELYNLIEPYFKESNHVDDIDMAVSLFMVNLHDVRRLIDRNTQQKGANQSGTIFFNPTCPFCHSKKIKDSSPQKQHNPV